MVKLTPREQTLVPLIVRGLCSAAIGLELGIAKSTAQSHMNNIYNKLGVDNRKQAMAKLATPAAKSVA